MHQKLNIHLIGCLALVLCLSARAEIPKSWFPAGSHPNEYEMSVDREVVHSGNASAHLKSIVPRTSGFGTLMQTFNADSFRGKRIRMSGYVRSKDVSDWAGLWMRVDGAKGQMLAFDNMQSRPIKASTDWTKYDVVLDVPEQAEQISFGLLLTGRGETWVDDMKFEVVGKDVPTTGASLTGKVPEAPTNLGFEE